MWVKHEKMSSAGIFRALLLALSVSAMIYCLCGAAVVWNYEDNASKSSSSEPIQPALPPVFSGSNVPGNASSSANTASTDSSSKDGGLWRWGGTPRGFSVANGTLDYPDDYYTSHFNKGYNNSASYGQNKLSNLSQYSTGFSTGYYAGNSIYSLLSDGKSSYDPWNNYPGYDPNYPYGYSST
jgi:hypothetical protein